MNKKSAVNKLLICLLLCGLLAACRGEDVDSSEPVFPLTPNPDAFARFINPAPGVPAGGVAAGEIHNLEDFPEAYYNTIDPNGSRDTLQKWQIANGFINEDGSPAECAAPSCVSTHVQFRDTKDLGYGRNMFMRWDKTTGDVAVYVENFQVDGIPGMPYGPLNFEALVNGEREWNFGVNAIEFSAFPNDASTRKFTKFYTFSGDGVRAVFSSGTQQHFVDLDGRGDRPMPNACIVCHGGHGRTLVVADSTGTKVLAPTISGGIPGDLQAQMQTIEFDTLQFANAQGFTPEDNEDGIRLINEAVLSTYVYRRDTSTPGTGDWDPTLAIETLNGRYGNTIDVPGTPYNSNFAPSGWSSSPGAQSVYNNPVRTNCLVCHAVLGSGLNTAIDFDNFSTFIDFADRIDHLVFERGLMPSGLLNYSNFWETEFRDPAQLAAFISRPERIDADDMAIPPGAPVAQLVAPPVAVGMSNGLTLDIPISAGGSAFAASYQYSVSPSDQATIVVTDTDESKAMLRADSPGIYTVTLAISGDNGGTDSISKTIDVREQGGTLLAAADTRFFGVDGTDINSLLRNNNCLTCHIEAAGFSGMPVYFEACNATNLQGTQEQGFDFLYRSVLARVNFDSPLDSLIVRKATNGATDLGNLAGSGISGYHGGNLQLNDDVELGRLLGWILAGAPRGDLPPASLIASEAPDCL